MTTSAPIVVLVGPATSYRLGAYTKAVRDAGATPVVLTDRPSAIGGATGTIAFGTTESLTGDDAAALDAFLTAIGGPPRAATATTGTIAAVIGTDAPALLTAAHLAQRAGLARVNTPPSVAAALDKSRQRLAAAGDPTIAQPDFRLVSPGDDAALAAQEVGFPAVVKPALLTASRGVQRVADPLDARAAANLAHQLSDRDAPVLVERFVEGGEVALEGLLNNGQLHVLAIFDKPDAPQGPTFPETLLVTPSQLPAATQEELAVAAAAACTCLGLGHGPVHIEFRVPPPTASDPRPHFLELAARTIGGRCAQMLAFEDAARGELSLEDLVVAQALGRLPTPPPPLLAGAVGTFMIPIPATGVVTAVHGVAVAQAVGGIDAVTIEVGLGEAVAALPHGDRYGGFLFARGDSALDVEAALTKAADAIRIDIDPASPETAATWPLEVDMGSDPSKSLPDKPLRRLDLRRRRAG